VVRTPNRSDDEIVDRRTGVPLAADPAAGR
jgi:hypothetical protein